MSGSEPTRYDAIVIGASVGGLAAAAYLARARFRVLVAEAGETTGGAAQTLTLGDGARASLFAPTLYALDWSVVHELDLPRFGLAFAQTAMKTVGLRGNGRHFVLSRLSCSDRNPDGLAPRDLSAYSRFKSEAYAFARKLRPLWIEGRGERKQPADRVADAAEICGLSQSETERLRVLAHMSAAAWLDHWFESDGLKTVLAYDAIAEPMSPDEPGSALMLLWRYAQTFARQGEMLQPLGGAGSLVAALELAARVAGAEIRLGAEVTGIAVEDRHVRGVTLAEGGSVNAPVVLSSLGVRHTLLNLLPADALGFGTMASLQQEPVLGRSHVAFVLSGPPPFVGLSDGDLSARLIVAGRLESASEAKAAALNGRVSFDPVLELTVPTAADPGLALPERHVVTASVPFTAIVAAKGWDIARETLKRQVLVTLEGFAPGFRDRILSMSLVAPPDSMHLSPFDPGSPLERLLKPYAARVTAPVAGLYFCGGAAEPATGLSGRAGRIAARLAIEAFGERQ